MRLHVLTASALAGLLSMPACQKTAQQAQPQRVEAPLALAEAPTDDAPRDARGAADPLAAASALLPADADVVLTAAWGPLFQEIAVRMFGLLPGRKDDPALRADFGAMTKRLYGVDLGGLVDLAAFVSLDEGAAAVVLSGRFSKERPQGTSRQVGGLEAWAVGPQLLLTFVGGHAVIGNEAGLGRLARVQRGELPRLAGSPAAASHAKARKALGLPAGALVMSTTAPSLLSATGAGGAAAEAFAAGSGSNGIVAMAAIGPPEALAPLEELVRKGLVQTRDQADAMLAQGRTAGDLTAAATGLLGGHHILRLVETVKTTRAGSTLLVRADTGLSSGSTLLGYWAVVAVPAFLKYTRRARTTEATDHIDKLYKGAAVYYTTPKVAADGRKLPCQFPPSTEWTPKGSPCDHPNQMYPADASAWSDPTWAALSFQMTGPHYFRYRIESKGQGADAEMVLEAQADLDCDGVWSTFRRTVFASPGAADGDCWLDGQSAFYVDNETE